MWHARQKELPTSDACISYFFIPTEYVINLTNQQNEARSIFEAAGAIAKIDAKTKPPKSSITKISLPKSVTRSVHKITPIT